MHVYEDAVSLHDFGLDPFQISNFFFNRAPFRISTCIAFNTCTALPFHTQSFLSISQIFLSILTDLLVHTHRSSCPYSQIFLSRLTDLLVHTHRSSCPYSQTFLSIPTDLLVHTHRSSCPYSQIFLSIITDLLVHTHRLSMYAPTLHILKSIFFKP
jgi:hypothetical protein